MRLPRAAVALAALLALAGCVTPARTGTQYVAKARETVQAASSEVATATLAAEQVLDRRLMRPYADEVVSADETALGAISDAFGSVQPPDPPSDDVREGVGGVVSDAEDAVAHARIALRRGDDADLRDAVRELHAVAADLAAAEERL